MSDGRVSIPTLLERHPRLALDSNVLIYLLERDEARAELVACLVDAIGTGQVEGVLGTFGLAEVLVGPARWGDAASFEMAASTVRNLGFLLQPLDPGTAEDAAWIRGTTGADLPDAMHLASARAAGATAFITNDRRIRAGPGLEVFYLDDLTLEQPLP